MRDFRTAKEAVRDALGELNARDMLWIWSAKVTMHEIHIHWSYFDNLDMGKETHFTISEGSDDFIKSYDEQGRYMFGAIVGNDFIADGNLSRCVYKLIKAIGYIAHTQY